MANLICVRLNRGDSSSWGFRLQGGKDFGTPLVVQKINGGSPAERAGLRAGDAVVKINNIDVYNLRHKDAQDVIIRAGPSFEIAVQRGGSTWKPTVYPVGSVPSPRPAASVNSLSPVTSTSLAAGYQEPIGAIGTTHNTAAKPFNQINGGPRIVNKQYNSPLPLYSEQSIAETLSAQSEVLSNGVLGVNFKKNEKSYDAGNSEVFRMVHEADKEPRDYEAEPSSGVITSPISIGGLRHVQAPENKPMPPTQQLPPGQNICADCERLIVGVFVRIKEKNLHVECFKCSTCGTSLKNVGYYNLNNKLYCDVHAKLAAKNNPPAPNLQPVTVPPGGRIPSGTISAALSSHHQLPSAAPLSPNINYSASPYQSGAPYSSPRSFSSVNAPLSPSSNFSKLSPTLAPPIPSTGCYSSVKPSAPIKGRSVQNIVWPPVPQSDSELPTASPLYFPPPSQVQIVSKPPPKDIDYELEEISNTNDDSDHFSLYSAEMSEITDRKSAMECSETLSESLDTQILVESIMKTKSKAPKNNQQPPHSGDVDVTFTVSEAQLKQAAYMNTSASSSVCCETSQSQECRMSSLVDSKQPQNLTSMYEKKIKVENTVPNKWESPMVVALTVASNKPYTDLSQSSTEETALDKNTFSQIPPKRSNSALASALATAPAAPFTPIGSSLEPVPLPEETVPYFPPERPVIPESKPKTDATPRATPSFKERSKKKEKPDELFQDLPKAPLERISMLAALTTAPERPYSPFGSGMSCHSETYEEKVYETEKIQEKTSKLLCNEKIQKPRLSPIIAPCKESVKQGQLQVSKANKSELSQVRQETTTTSETSSNSKSVAKNVRSREEIIKLPTGLPPLIQMVRSSFETKTDKVQMEMSCQFLGDSNMQEKICKTYSQTDACDEKCHKEMMKETKTLTQTRNAEITGNTEKTGIATKRVVMPFASFQNDTNCISEGELLQKATSTTKSQTAVLDVASVKNHSNITKPSKEPITVINPGQQQLNVPKISFQPVNEDATSQTFSPRPRSLTPSMINKSAPILPQYQAKLVPMKCSAAETNVLDPTTPSTSRSPSPYPGRPSSPFVSPSTKAVSPAPGPPPNPLQSGKSPMQLVQEGRVEHARSHLQNFIPQHQSKTACRKSYQNDCVSSGSDLTSRVSMMQSMKQQQLHKQANVESFESSSDGLVQIQRKKKVTEEYEHTQKSTEIEKYSASVGVHSYQTSDAQNQQGVVGSHVTNPQPMKSPFISANCCASSNIECIQATNCNKKTVLPSAIPILNKPSPSVRVNPTASASSIGNVNKPNVSQPNTGTGGGRQAGAVGVAPRRGRGILNLATTPGSRVPLCGQCNSHIRGPFITALGKIWCPDHFICATPSCRRALHDLGFVEERGQLYCEYCFEQYLAPSCSKCNSKVKGDCLKAVGKNFHPECFNCVYCGKLFGNSPFFLEDCQPYCEADWNELFTTKCFACGFPVEAGDRWVEALNNNYHSQCFNCTMCKKNLEGQSFFAKGGRPYCKNHAR